MPPDIRISVAGQWGKQDWWKGPFKWVVTSCHDSASSMPKAVVCDTLDEAIIVLKKWCDLWTPAPK